MILGVIAEVLAELFANVQLRRHKLLNRLFWIILAVLVAVVVGVGLLPLD